MRKSILIIEDEADMRDAIATALSKADFHVITAENGEAGYQTAIDHEPDLILLDLMMPVMNGQETLAKLRNHPWGHDAKVVILTAMDDVMNVGTAYEQGISGYITKSTVSLAEIVNQVRKIIHTD